MTGYVRKIFLDKGFAFIEGSDQRDYFCHWSKILRSSVPFRNMKENDKVTFTFEEGDQGPKALNVLIVREDPNGRTDTNDLRQGQQIPGERGQGERGISAGRLGDDNSSEPQRSDRGSGEPSSGTGTSNQGPGFNNLGQYSDLLRGNDTPTDRSGPHDEAGDRPRSGAGGRAEAQEAGDLHQPLDAAEHQDQTR